MTGGVRIFPSRGQAEAAAGPAEHIRVIGRTYLVVPDDTDPAPLLRGLTTGARTSDPDTSHLAAAKDRTGDRWAVLDFHRKHPDGVTDFEMAALMARKQTSVGVRRKELVDLGYVEDSGQRRPSDTGSPAIVWRLTEAGRAAP